MKTSKVNPSAIAMLRHLPYEGEAQLLRLPFSIALDAPQNATAALAGKIGSLQGVSVKTAYSGVVG